MNNQPFPLAQARDPARFLEAMRRFDAANARDPNLELVHGAPRPRELLYSQRLTDWVLKLSPQPSEELLLAARSQHICRWTIPRDTYPMTRAGYLRWRNDLKSFHARKTGEILGATGYPDDFIARVQALNLKSNFPQDPDSQILEDALCLVFLEFQLTPLADKTDEKKVVNALKKSWAKMSPAARQHALRLPCPPREKRLIELALSPEH